MLIAIILILAALVFYSTAVFSEKIKKKLQIWMVAVFTLGFLSDLSGTIIMASVSGKITVNVHTFFGSLALIIMALHLSWALQALMVRGQAEKLFRRYSLYAWIIWLAAFFTGLPGRIF